MTNIVNYCLSPGLFKLDGGAMFGIIPKPLWEKKNKADEYNRIDLDLRLWLIKTEKRNILVDTGIGDYHGEKFDEQFNIRQSKNPLKELLAKVSLTPNDITDLVISHLHFDHIGGIITKDGSQVVEQFSNATIHLHKDHYEYSLNPTMRDGGSFHKKTYGPIIERANEQGRVNWLKGEEGEILDLSDQEKLMYKCSFGHTPHLLHPYTSSHIYLTDLIPTSSHVHIPWVMGYDINPGVTTDYKQIFLKFIVENNLTVIFEHDPKYWGAKIHIDEKGRYSIKEGFLKEQRNLIEI